MQLKIKKQHLTLLLLGAINSISFANSDPGHKDSLGMAIDTTRIQPIFIKAYFGQQNLFQLTTSAQVISSQQIEQQQNITLLPALNTVAGLRMEERSPGSYRLALRGSMIRSPFGVRNIKVYMDEFSLTDAGGNTYLNSIEPAAIQRIQVLKGPDGSIFGANSGGIIQIEPKGFGEVENSAQLSLNTGSYGLFQQQASIQRRMNNSQMSIDQSYLRADGYREHSSILKNTVQTTYKYNYRDNGNIRALFLFSDLKYDTPGGLTQAQVEANPKSSRPASGTSPGAQEQRAGIKNRTFFGGIAQERQLSAAIDHSISLFGTTTRLENPFITNYELREESNLGLRTYLSYKGSIPGQVDLHMQLGAESSWNWNQIDNYENIAGSKGNMEDVDKLQNQQLSIFYRISSTWYDKLILESSIGLNQNKINFEKLFPDEEQALGNINFGFNIIPRIALNYLFNPNFSTRASVARGFSPPTIGEIRPSTKKINEELKPEYGTNYEVGFRWKSTPQNILIDLTAYHYRMNDGIIRQLDEDGADYYLNAGQITQRALEASLWWQIINGLSIHSSAAYQYYRFNKYQVAGQDYSGNNVTAVPEWTISNSLQIKPAYSLSINILYNYVSSSPLDDANTVFAKPFHLLQSKLIWEHNLYKKIKVHYTLGVDNLLNQAYSLGNDINAFGGRYFNPSAPRNYFGGVKLIY